jgi:hypothetical protein
MQSISTIGLQRRASRSLGQAEVDGQPSVARDDARDPKQTHQPRRAAC